MSHSGTATHWGGGGGGGGGGLLCKIMFVIMQQKELYPRLKLPTVNLHVQI